MTNKQSAKKMKLLICGSKAFDDTAFVYGMLNQLYEKTNFNISHIFTSRFSGACEIARSWAELINSELPDSKKIIQADCTFDMHLSAQNLSFYEEAHIPEIIARNDPFFKKGRDLLYTSGVNMVLAFPNAKGELGASTRNIQRFCETGDVKVPFLNGTQAYQMLKELNREPVSIPEKFKPNPSGFGSLQNKHSFKR